MFRNQNSEFETQTISLVSKHEGDCRKTADEIESNSRRRNFGVWNQNNHWPIVLSTEALHRLTTSSSSFILLLLFNSASFFYIINNHDEFRCASLVITVDITLITGIMAINTMTVSGLRGGLEKRARPSHNTSVISQTSESGSTQSLVFMVD